MPKTLPKRTCPTCFGHRVKRNGSTTAGTPRYRCLDCGASHTLKRPQTADANTYTSFVNYLLGKASQVELKRGSDRTIRRSFSWCWLVPVPSPTVTGEVHDQVFIDATYLHGGWVLLIACTTSHVIGWQLATRESSTAYTQLLTPIPPPKMVVTDGAGGALKAIKTTWPTTHIQRCLIHVKRNNITDLTHKPRTPAGIALKGLSDQLPHITNVEQATEWVVHLHDFYQTYRQYLKERTYAKDVPANERKPGKTWWYTHERDRRVYHRLNRLLEHEQLFTFLAIQAENPRSNTNPVESINSQIKRLFNLHRGWSSIHQIQAAYHYLNTRTEFPLTPRQIHANWIAENKPTYTPIPTPKPPTPTTQNSINEQAPWEDGLVIRTGWAGRRK